MMLPPNFKQTAYAHKDKDNQGAFFFHHIVSSLKTLQYYIAQNENKEVYKIVIGLNKNQMPETRNSHFTVDYWGWADNDKCQKKGQFELTFIQHAWPLFSMQFAGGGINEEAIGRGKIYRLAIIESEIYSGA